MKTLKKSAIIWIIVAGLIAIGSIFALSNRKIIENVKRETAKIFVYEYIPDQNVNLDSCEVSRQKEDIYQDFRKQYRFHYQTIGLADFADSSRLIMLSELPPHFELDSIPVIFKQFKHKVEIRKHPIGYDGYVTDVLISLGNATQENCENLIKRLNKILFFTDYKPAVTELPVTHKRQYFAQENIDYQITLNEFNTWFMEENEGFMTLKDTNTILSISDMFQKKTRGVFFSQQPGFVAWAIAKNKDIALQKKFIRQFTLDADLILGALADDSTLVIIGRERQSPLYELPPLQIESILLLASTTEKELSQSLDINDLMAGKMKNGKDWCPTYLSKELENTEFGDLMTITDILLKDWSEHGTIQESYYRYPSPGYYPFDKPLFRKLGLNELVYNWNTADAMYAIDQDGYTIYTLNRTGSLPVSYFNSQERSESIGYRYENQAYHYFATLSNTDLARVVQYTALYQLFIDNHISYSGDTYPSFPKNKPFLLYKPTVQLLTIIQKLSNEQISQLADTLSKRIFAIYQKDQVDKQLRDNEQNYNVTYTPDNIDYIYKDVHRNTKSGLTNDIIEIKNMLNSLSEDQYRQLAKFLSYPRGITVNSREKYNTLLRARKINEVVRAIGKNNLDLIGVDLNDVKNFFAGNLSKNSGKYTKTSSLIITFNDMITTGGHNLSSKISRVHSMTNYKHSKGNYTPSDYEKPVQSKPDIADTQPVASQPKAASSPSSSHSTPGKSHGAAPSGKSVPSHTTTTKTSNSKSSTSKGSTTNIRPRSAVISNAPRSNRGF